MKKVFLDDLPRKGKRIYWINCVGFNLNFVYDDVEGNIKINSYDSKTKYLTIEYDKKEYNIKYSNLSEAKIGGVIGKVSKEFLFDVGKTISDNNRDITIIDRIYIDRPFKDSENGKEYIKNEKNYKYKCNKCGNEDIMKESNIIRGSGCNACCNPVRKIVLGINTIYDKAKWMIDLGISEEDAKRYTPQSNAYIIAKCPHCDKENKCKISEIYRYKSIGCICGDGYSYGHKYMHSLLEQIGVDFKQEVRFEWCKFYNPFKKDNTYGIYDFVIEDIKIIIEIDGEWHRVDNNMTNQSSEESRCIDDIKDNLAITNGYKVIRVFYDSNNTSIDTYILNSELSNIFNLDNIDMSKCEKLAIYNNKIKEICEYWNNKDTTEVALDLAIKFNIDDSNIRKYLKKGTKLGWCNYDPKEEFNKSRIKCGEGLKRRLSKKVEIFKDESSLGVFESSKELERQSEELFGYRLSQSKISLVCSGKKPQYKGYTFKYVNNQEGVA